MAEKYLIDTSAVIKYLNETFPGAGLLFLDKTLKKESVISFITEIELQVWEPPDINDMKIYKSFIEQSIILSINQEIIQKTINIRKLNKPKLSDALIAGTAIVYDRTLIADNDKDFSRIPELKYMNPKNIR